MLSVATVLVIEAFFIEKSYAINFFVYMNNGRSPFIFKIKIEPSVVVKQTQIKVSIQIFLLSPGIIG